MYSKQILGFIIYFWIDSYIDWIVILFEKKVLLLSVKKEEESNKGTYVIIIIAGLSYL